MLFSVFEVILRVNFMVVLVCYDTPQSNIYSSVLIYPKSSVSVQIHRVESSTKYSLVIYTVQFLMFGFLLANQNKPLQNWP